MTTTRAQILATIGPPSSDLKLLEAMMRAGMDAARINFSHGTYESNGLHIDRIRSAAESVGKKVPIIQDLSGPRSSTDEGHAFDSEKSVITEKDLLDLEFGIAKGVSYIAQSYIGSATHVEELRSEISKRDASIPIIAKIERAEAVSDIDGIIKVSDAIMIARGDLGLAIPYEDLPFVERDIIARCNTAGKSVIVATEMLLSMMEKTRPTRAEVTDVAFAIISGADVIMLSDETAKGKHPLEAVTAMERVALRAETSVAPRTLHLL